MTRRVWKYLCHTNPPIRDGCQKKDTELLNHESLRAFTVSGWSESGIFGAAITNKADGFKNKEQTNGQEQDLHTLMPRSLVHLPVFRVAPDTLVTLQW